MSATDKFNVNTLLITILMGLSGWSLVEQNAQGKAQAANSVRSDTQARELALLWQRTQANELAIQEIKIQIAKMR